MRNAVKILVGVGILLAPVVYAQTTTTYTYDNLGRLKTVSSASAYATTYSYDSADNRTSVQTTASSSSSSGINHAPVCSNSTIVMTGLPSYASAQPSVSSSQILFLCTDADGDTMTVTSPTPLPYSQNLPVGQNSVSFPFTVSDGRGGTASGTITYQRP